MSAKNSNPRAGGNFENLLADVFRKAGWQVSRPTTDDRVDLILSGRDQRYVVELKVSSEGRSDRLIPMLSQAILQAQAAARQFPDHVVPLAVVAAKRIPEPVAERLKHLEGLRSFVGPGLEGLDAKPSRRRAGPVASRRLPDLFSDLNQWMLKILLGQLLPESLVSVPREPIRNASQLAEAANVSVMSASRLVNRLSNEGFLDEDRDHLHLVRVEELLERWLPANRKMSRDIPARWVLKRDLEHIFASIAQYARESAAGVQPTRRTEVSKARPPCCVGVFAAADLLGLGLVRGVPPHIYLERLDSGILQRLGLSVEDAPIRPDVYIRVPSNKEAVLRAVVLRDGVPVSDVVQVWLDASVHPARGRAQADEIRRRVLRPLFGKSR
jgi:hypothetical protein